MKKTILISFICSIAFLKGLGQITTITSTITSIQDTSCAGSTITLYYQFKNNATVTTTLTNVCAKMEFGVLTSPTIIGSSNSFSIVIPAGATTSLSAIIGIIPATASGLNRIRIRAYTNCSAAGGGNLPNPPDFIYIMNTPVTPNITSNGTPAVCPSGNSSVQLTSSATGTVLWSNGQTTPTITVNTSGSYTVSNTNMCGTSTSAPYIVYQRHLPTVNILSTPTTGCDSVTLYSSGTYYNSLSWSSGQLDSTATFTNSGMYYAIATNTCGSVNSNTVSVVINSSPTVTVSKNSSIKCAGQIDTLIAIGANSYNWTIGGNTNTISINPTAQTVYNVSGTDVNGCSGLGSFTVLVNPLPALTIATTNTLLCVGQTATLSANGASTPPPLKPLTIKGFFFEYYSRNSNFYPSEIVIGYLMKFM
jgi:hypothetical protein